MANDLRTYQIELTAMVLRYKLDFVLQICYFFLSILCDDHKDRESQTLPFSGGESVVFEQIFRKRKKTPENRGPGNSVTDVTLVSDECGQSSHMEHFFTIGSISRKVPTGYESQTYRKVWGRL